MGNYLLRRLVVAVPSLLGISLILFVLLALAPGDPFGELASNPNIPPEVRDKIFAAGFTTKPIGEGTGLGLSITREIVEDTHGGRIWFDTEAGKGTTFHVRIPIDQRKRSADWQKTDSRTS